MRMRLVPRYAVNWRLPAKIPIDKPLNVTSIRAPSVFTLQEVVLNDELARRMSSGFGDVYGNGGPAAAPPRPRPRPPRAGRSSSSSPPPPPPCRTPRPPGTAGGAI